MKIPDYSTTVPYSDSTTVPYDHIGGLDDYITTSPAVIKSSPVPLNDPVNHPSHYASGKIECIDAMEVATEGLTGIEAVCAGNAIKYIWRHQKKGKPIEDIEKAIWYLNHLLEHYKEVK